MDVANAASGAFKKPLSTFTDDKGQVLVSFNVPALGTVVHFRFDGSDSASPSEGNFIY